MCSSHPTPRCVSSVCAATGASDENGRGKQLERASARTQLRGQTVAVSEGVRMSCSKPVADAESDFLSH